jgi:hypothetical protein
MKTTLFATAAGTGRKRARSRLNQRVAERFHVGCAAMPTVRRQVRLAIRSTGHSPLEGHLLDQVRPGSTQAGLT